ncbi:MAG: DegV family protein [Clostridia bacterium]|nr:DegV family protein [Clostridia bacterium]
MPDYVISCCSTADLSEAHYRSRDIARVSFRYQLDGTDYTDDFWKSMEPSAFYQAMLDGAQTRTSQVGVGAYEAFWTPFLEQGKDIIHVCLSSGISGTMNSARIAADDLEKLWPERRIIVIDSLGASSGYGLLVDAMADRRDQGFTLDELAEWTEKNKLRIHYWFFSSDLTFYIRGGRVSRTAGFIGKLLNVCPLLNMDDHGRLIPREKIRGKRKVIREIVDRMAEHADGGECYNGKCYISHSDCIEDAKAVAAMIESRFPDLNGDVVINDVGPTIGTHTGPGTVALFFWGDERTE